MARKPKGGDDMEMQNAAKTLMANIRFMSVDNPIRSLVFTSSIPNEGKSTVTCNVARAIASSGMRVCLVECDMRNRTLAGMLGVRSTAVCTRCSPIPCPSSRPSSPPTPRTCSCSMPSRTSPIPATSLPPTASRAGA